MIMISQQEPSLKQEIHFSSSCSFNRFASLSRTMFDRIMWSTDQQKKTKNTTIVKFVIKKRQVRQTNKISKSSGPTKSQKIKVKKRLVLRSFRFKNRPQRLYLHFPSREGQIPRETSEPIWLYSWEKVNGVFASPTNDSLSSKVMNAETLLTDCISQHN